MKRKPILLSALAVMGATAAFAVANASVWVDSAGKRVTDLPEGQRSTAVVAGVAASPFNVADIAVLHESTSRAVNDLASAFGDKEELIATCSIPAQDLMAVVLKPGAPENRFRRIGDMVNSFWFWRFHTNKQAKLRVGRVGGGETHTDWVNIRKNYRDGSRFYEFKEIAVPKRDITIKLNKKTGYQVLMGGIETHSNVGDISDLAGSVVAMGVDNLADGALHMPVISYVLPRIYSWYGHHMENKNGNLVHIFDYIDGDALTEVTNSYYKLNYDLKIATIESHLINTPINKKTDLFPAWFGFDQGGDIHAGEMYKSAGKIDIKNSVGIINATHVRIAGTYSRNLTLEIEPVMATNQSGRSVSALTNPFIVSGGWTFSDSWAGLPVGGQSENTYFKNILGNAQQAPLIDVPYPASQRIVTINCTLN